MKKGTDNTSALLKEPNYGTKNKSRIKPTAIVLGLSAILNFSACKIDKHGENNEYQDDSEAKEIIDGNKATETWEYKLYKLQLNSIIDIKYDLVQAKKKISQSECLQKYINHKDLAYESLLPKIIKETMMNNNSTSKTGAQGYMQLTDRAIEEIYRKYDLSDSKLDKDNPVDNLILGILYRKITENQISNMLEKTNFISSESGKKALMVLSYNIGPTRMINLLKESKAKDIDSYIRYLTKYIGMSYNPKKVYDETYNVEYTNVFGNKNISDNLSWEYKKIAEGIRYLAIIQALQLYLESGEVMEIIGVVALNDDTTLFSHVKKMRDSGVFRKDASINDICIVILETNGFRANQTPSNIDLFLIKDALQQYLN